MTSGKEAAAADSPGADELASTPDFAAAATLADIEELAQRRLPHLTYEYIASGAADEITVRRNCEDFDRLRLRPRVCSGIERVDLRITLLGEELAHPILLAPTAYHRVVHPDGEVATAIGAGAASAVFVVSTATTATMEEITRVATAPLWFQLYIQSSREYTLELVQMAEAAGCKALCLTVDNTRLGARNRQERSGFRLPPGVITPYLDDLNAGRRGLMSAEPVSVTWKEVAWLRSATRLPVLLKGILTGDDTRQAVDAGVAGVFVSNHAGRNLDTLPSTIEAISEVAEAAGSRLPVVMDGGIRRGTDVVKALALGADAVMIGRPYLYGLGLGGSEGVRRVVEILVRETEEAMATCGCAAIAEIDRTVLWN